MLDNDDIEVKFWYNVVTGEVERGAQSDFTQLLGPYNTREDAEKALQKVKARNKEWDSQDEDQDDSQAQASNSEDSSSSQSEDSSSSQKDSEDDS